MIAGDKNDHEKPLMGAEEHFSNLLDERSCAVNCWRADCSICLCVFGYSSHLRLTLPIGAVFAWPRWLWSSTRCKTTHHLERDGKPALEGAAAWTGLLEPDRCWRQGISLACYSGYGEKQR